ncbi:hypothetical protein V8G54_033857 [Vigna mungo]|uniref:Uncharacterized protein n=1 Tax=Vigna mungo TaxID=3915 RepID=A0AAQ3MQJ4_VIGMU
MEIVKDVEGVSIDERSSERTTIRRNLYQGCFQGSRGVVTRIDMLKGTYIELGSSRHISMARRDGGGICLHHTDCVEASRLHQQFRTSRPANPKAKMPSHLLH